VIRRVLTGALLCACAVAISACGVRFDGAPSATQRDVIGDVVITTKLCSTPEGSCGPIGGDGGKIQSLIAYRVPAGAKAPALSADNSVAYHRDDDLAEQYEAADHADGMHWFAFVSDVVTIPGDQTVRETIDAAFALPAGAPYRGPFAYKTVTGFRQVPSDVLAGDPVVCAGQQNTRGIEESPGAPAASCDEDDASGSVDTRDLALSAPAASRAFVRASIQQGSGGDVPFTATFAGPSSTDADFAMSASVPGLGAATVSPSRLVPEANSTTPLTVHVDVPAGATPGTYPVTLTARLANGQTRTATGTLTVTAGPGTPVTTGTPAPAATSTSSQGVTFNAPSEKKCLSRRTFTVMLLKHGRTLTDGKVTVNGKRVAVRRGGKHMTARIDLRGLTGTISVRIRASLKGGGKVDFTRRYRTCSSTPGDNGLKTKKDAI
jgi:hypothetical protein